MTDSVFVRLLFSNDQNVFIQICIKLMIFLTYFWLIASDLNEKYAYYRLFCADKGLARWDNI